MQKETIKKAFLKSIPILCSYVFVSMAYGITMEEAGFAWYQSGCVYRSISVCAGFIFKWWNFYYYDCGDCIFDEQQADLLQFNVCR